MYREVDACTTRAMTQLWRNQIAICETLHILASWLAETGQTERLATVMRIAGQLLNSDRVVEPALGRLVEMSGARFQPANDD